MPSDSVYAHIVCYKSSATIERCVAALLNQEGYSLNHNLFVRITDNNEASLEDWSVLEKLKAANPDIDIERLNANLGFAAGHNLGVGEFLRSRYDRLLILNPDLALAPDALSHLVSALSSESTAHAACPLLLRANSDLTPSIPSCIDGFGMRFTKSLRHFDAFAEMPLEEVTLERSRIFGASGAAILLSRQFIERSVIPQGRYETDSELLYPQLAQQRTRRVYLFDEAFFAYREDADLAWRANMLGLSTIGVPEAVGFHVRRVTPERRAELPAHINRWSVRNRFLLLLNNAFGPIPFAIILSGMLMRNIIVVSGVLLREWGSLPAFRDLWKLRRRARERRGALRARISDHSIREVWNWFK